MTDKKTKALKLALEDLLMVWEDRPSITAIREALAEQPSGIKQVIELYDSPEQPAQQGCMRCNTPKKCALYGCSPLTWPAEQPAPPPPECQTEAEKTAFAFGWWKALEMHRTPAQQQGWKLVPVQPTDEMRDAGNAIIKDRGALFAAYRAMLNAAPQPAQQEPVITKNEKGLTLHVGWDDLPAGTKLYTSPQPRKPWVGLTDEEKSDLWCESTGRDCVNEDTHVFADAIEAKLKEKNT